VLIYASPVSIINPKNIGQVSIKVRHTFTALLDGGSRDRSPVVSLEIFSEATDGTMCSGVDSASKNEYQENSWGVKTAGA
jgi:hypothetical protein